MDLNSETYKEKRKEKKIIIYLFFQKTFKKEFIYSASRLSVKPKDKKRLCSLYQRSWNSVWITIFAEIEYNIVLEMNQNTINDVTLFIKNSDMAHVSVYQ